MNTYPIEDISLWKNSIHAGDCISLSGFVYTARDAAHKKIFELLDKKEELPFEINGACIYYAGPTSTPPEGVIGSVGPTTSSRMDIFTPRLLNMGLSCMIGKGDRSKDVVQSIADNKALYFCAVGGAGAYIANCVKSCKVIAFEELGCESIKKLYVEDFMVFCGIDTFGNTIFNR